MQYQREILDAVRRIMRSLRESSRIAENELGLSGAQLLVLQFLKDGKALSINELAERTRTHQSSVSIVVTKLVDAKLAKRQTCKKDGRKAEIILTSSGKSLLKKKSTKLAHEKLCSAVSELSITKQKQLAALLTQLVEASGFADQPATLFLEDDQEKNK